jgi:uncharacterized lipoprotein YddW (UPF0748 family)
MPQEKQGPELRGVWLTNVDSRVLETREGIAEAMQFLADHNFNMVYPVVWNKAFTLYPSTVMDSLFGRPIDTLYMGRDPLAEVIEEAHARGIAVIPWFEFGFSSSHQENGGPILARKPEWAARDKSGKLLEKNGFEWMNAYHPEVQSFMLSLIMEVVENYAVDGIQGDDRLPAQPSEGGYSEYTRQLYAEEHNGATVPERHDDPDFLRWRAGKLTEFAENVYHSVKSVDSSLIVSWSPSIYPWSFEEYLQDWPAWIEAGAVDLLHPQCYRYELASYKEVIDKLDALPAAGFPHIYPGVLMNVGDYVIEPDFLLDAIQYHRKRGYNGEVFFFYEGLRKENDKLAKTLLRSFYLNPAELPFDVRFKAGRN